MESWTLHSEKTGFEMLCGDTPIGGWDRSHHCLFILESYLQRLPDQAAGRDVLRRFGFRSREQLADRFRWTVPAAEFRSFVDALMALARLPAALAWEESLEPKPGPR